MKWNWQLPDWPRFSCDFSEIAPLEKEFTMGLGSVFAFLKTLPKDECNKFIVEILTLEGQESAKIEGEILDRESLQSSIKRHFGLDGSSKKKADREAGMTEVLLDVYETFDEPLTHEMLWRWHKMLFKGRTHIADIGQYRSHEEPMQIVSGRHDRSEVFFEAPPSAKVLDEMRGFVDWFNHSRSMETVLGRAAIAHLYFENIHPFEDGNGRIGRVLVEKVLSQGVGRPVLIAVSKILEKRRKQYYKELGRCNRTLSVQEWVVFFAKAILEAQKESLALLYFLIQKSKLMIALTGQLNLRQEKVLLRMFAEGPEGFKGGLSAENYIAITKTSRATATRDLNDLVEKRALIKSGEFRYARYRLNIKVGFC